MEKFLTLENVNNVIRNGAFTVFSLYYKQYEHGTKIHVLNYYPPDCKKQEEHKPEFVDRAIAKLQASFEEFKNLPGVIFAVLFKHFITESTWSGPHEFLLPGDNGIKTEDRITQGNQGLGGLGLDQLRSLIAIESKSALNDFREKLINEREIELKSDIEEFERLKINPAAANISKGVGLALTKFFNSISPDDEQSTLSGNETESTKAAEELANDLVDSKMSAEEIKEIHKIIKANKLKTNQDGN